MAATLTGTIQAAAAARHWPDPPASWLHSSTVTCIRIRESGNGVGSPNLYGMLAVTWAALGGTGWAGNASRSEQDYRAWLLWNRQGCSQAWGRWDGCC
jgi:hypothetical protein